MKLILLFAFATKLLILVALAAEPVVDTNGKPILIGGNYYVMSSIFGAAGGGGLIMGRTGNSEYPDIVLQDYSEVYKGIPVRFTNTKEHPNTDMLYKGSDFAIDFLISIVDIGPTEWVVVDDLLSGSSYVGIGGAQYHPGNLINDGFFKIEEYGRGYKFVFCPSVTLPLGKCFDIGRKDDKEGRRLLLIDQSANEPFEVVFVKKID